MNTRVFLSLFTLSALCLCIYGANITPFLINVAPSWGTNCYDTSMRPLSSGCPITTDTSTTPVTSIIAWGELAAGQNLTSRVRVRGPAASSAVNPGTGGLFLLSHMTHDNFLVTDANKIPRFLDLSWAVQVKDVNANQTVTLNIQGKLEVVETPNVPSQDAGSPFCDYTSQWQNPYGIQYTSSLPCCPFPSIANNPCSDRLTATINNAGQSAPITVNGITYQIIIKGFCSDVDANNCNFGQTYSFISQEEFSSTRYLFASLIVVCGTNTGTSCTERAAEISVCTSGVCVSGQCDFGVNQNTLGNTCTPSDTLTTACGSDFRCAATNTSTGGTVGLCQAQRFASEGTTCSVSGLGPKPCQITACDSNHYCNYKKLSLGSACGNTPATECTSYSCQSTSNTEGIDCLVNYKPTSTPCTSASAQNPNNLDTQTCSVPRCLNGQCTWLANTAMNGQQCGSNNGNNVCNPNKCNNGYCQPALEAAFTNQDCSVTANPQRCNGPCCTSYCDGKGSCIGGTKSSSTPCTITPQGNANDKCNYGQCAGLGSTNFGVCELKFNSTDTLCNPSASTDCVKFYCRSGSCQGIQSAARTTCSNPSSTPTQCQIAGCSNGQCAVLDRNDVPGRSCLWPNEFNSQPYGNCSIAQCNTNGQCVLYPRPATTYNNGVLSFSCGSAASIGPCAYYGCNGLGNGSCVVGYYPRDSNVKDCDGKPDQCSQNKCPGDSGTCTAYALPGNPSCTNVGGTTVGTRDDGKYCVYGTCNNRICTSTNKAANITCDINTNPNRPTVGTCQRAACDANGVCQVLPYNNPNFCTTTNICYNPICTLTNNVYRCDQVFNNIPCNNADPQPSDTQCQIQQCSSGSCLTLNQPDGSTCTKSGSAGSCRTWGCQNGACTAIINTKIGCTGPLPCYQYSCNANGNCDAKFTDSNSCNNGTIDACHVWKCRNGGCQSVAGNDGVTCVGASTNPCIKFTCNNGNCAQDLNANNNNSCSYPNLPQCKKAICLAGQCTPVNAFDGNNCDTAITNNNVCNVRTCVAGTCTNQDQTGKQCLNNGPDTLCLINRCQGTTCAQANRNEDLPCDPTQANVTGDAACKRSVCVAGACQQPVSYWDGQPCGQGSQGTCSEYRCMSGNCDRTTNYAIPAGTSCSTSTNPCIDYQCNGAYQCISTNSAGAACYNPVLTFKRAGEPANVTLLASGCQAYTCSGGSCTTNIQNIDKGICIGNFTDPCLSGICQGGKCLPTLIANCSTCGNYKDCKSCQAGSFSSKRSTSTTDYCRLNPNLAGCVKGECSWCRGRCLSTSEVTEYNTYFPPGSSNNINCDGKCPVVLVGGDGDDNALPLGLGLGLGGGALLLAALAALAVIIALIVKRKMASPDANMATTAFVDSKATAVNPLHETDTAVKTNALHVG